MIRPLSFLFVLISLLTACGSVPSAVEPTSAPPPAAEAVAPIVEPTATSAAAATRTVTHAFGTTEVPLKPQRVVTLDAFFTLTPLVELGVPVVGSVSLGEPVAYPGLTDAEGADITSIGNGRLASLEAVAALKPDLIIGVDFVEPPYDELSQIAPTVIIPTALDWKAQHRALGEATGTLEQAEAGIAAYEARVAALKARMPELTVSYLTLTGETPVVYTMGPQAWAPIRVLDDAGVQRPANEVATEDSFFTPVSLELLPELKGDVLLYATGYPGIDDTSAGYAPAVTESPIWQRIPAVQAGRAYEVTGACWETFGGLRSANCVLDDIERLLLSGAPAPAGDSTEAYQVPGFPAYAPASPLLEVLSRSNTNITVKHAYGETAIPANPQRIFVNDPATLQILLSLGITPAGPTTFTPELPVALQEQGVAVTLLPDLTGEGINLEQLAALKPDLILGHASQGPGMISAEQYERLSQIAPTVAFTGNPFFYWKEATAELGAFFGVPERASQVLADYEAKVDGYRERVKAAIGEESVTVLLLFDTTMWLYSVGGMLEDRYVPLSPTGWVFRELRLTPGPEVRQLAGDQLWAELSLELIPELKADHLVVFPNAYGGEEQGAGLDDYFGTPLWQTVPAVQAGNVHVLTADNAVEGYWTTPFLIEQFLETVE